MEKKMAFCPELEHPNDQTVQFIPLIKTNSMPTTFPWEFLCLSKENGTVLHSFYLLNLDVAKMK